MGELEKILITGDTEGYGLNLLLKLLNLGYWIKVLDQYIYNYSDRDNFDYRGLGFRYNPRLVLKEGSPDDVKLFKKSIETVPFPNEGFRQLASGNSQCDSVVYLVSSKENSKKIDYNFLCQLAHVSKDCGIRRFIYISSFDLSKEKTLFMEYLRKITNSNFAVVTIHPLIERGYLSRLILPIGVKLIENKIINKGKITIYNLKQETFQKYINSIPNVVSYLLRHSTQTIKKDLLLNIATYRYILNNSSFFHKLYEHKKDLARAIIRRFFSYLKHLKRLFDVFMMMLLLHLWPEQVYRFSTRRLLPDKTRKYPKGNPFHHAYEFIQSKSSDIKKVRELNLVIPRGASFNLKLLESLKPPVYLACLGNPINNNKDYIYVTSRRMVTYFKKLGYQTLIVESYTTDYHGNRRPFAEALLDNTTDKKEKALYRDVVDYTSDCNHIAVHEKVFHHGKLPIPSWAPVGSGLPSVYGLSFIAEKINVYGWDFHMQSSPEKMNYWQVLLSLYQYKHDKGARYQFESGMINFYYAYHLSQMPNVNIYGYLGQLSKHKKLIDRIERALFNCA